MAKADFMERYMRFILRHRVAVLIVFVLLSLVSLMSLSRAVIASSVGKLFLGESPKYKFYLEQGQAFGSDEILVVGIDDPNYLTKNSQRRLKASLKAVETLSYVRRIDSFLSARKIKPGASLLNTTTYAELALQNTEQINPIKAQLKSDPLYSGILIARDGESIAVLVEFTQDTSRSAEDAPNMVSEIKSCFNKAGYAPTQLHTAGLTVVMAEVISQTFFNLTRIFPFTAALLLLTVWLLFRRLWPAALSLAVAFLGVLWTMGFAIQLDRQVNVMMSGIPIIVLIVAFSDVVHLCSAYLLELADGKDKTEAIIGAGKDVGRACIYTSITTFVGFLGMSFVPTPVFRLLGITLGLGVAIALLQAITLVPILFSYLERPKPLRGGPTALVQKGLDRSMILMQDFALKYAWQVLAVFAILLGLSCYGITKIRIETDLAKRLDPKNHVRLDQDWFSKRFSGSNFLDIYIESPDKSSFVDPTWLNTVYEFERQLEQDPDIDRAQSYVDILALISQVQSTSKTQLTIPKTKKAALQAMFLLQNGAGSKLKRLLNTGKKLMRITVRVNGDGFRKTAIAGNRAIKLGQSFFKDKSKLSITGLTYILGDWLDTIIAGQRRGLLISIAVITLMMIVCFRSIAVGLWSMIPNLLPLFAVGGWVGLTWDKVDSDTVTIGLLAIGIGVDDTIHFLSRYRVEIGRGHNSSEALRRTFAFAGRAIIMTTLIFVVGVLPFITSDYFTTQIFGTLLPLCFIVALLADLLLVPAMARIGLIQFPANQSP
jgi:uncharacterized protein